MARGRDVEATEVIEESGFAGARRPKQNNKFAFVEIEIHARERVNFGRAHAINLGQTTDPKDLGFGGWRRDFTRFTHTHGRLGAKRQVSIALGRVVTGAVGWASAEVMLALAAK